MEQHAIPRPEHPRPQLVRQSWLNLNGQWQFEIDHGKSGRPRGLVEAETLSGTITVPFCPESKLSGVENKDFMNAVWYKKTVEVPQDWAGSRVLLHFGAVDYDTEVWVNGTSVGKHRGGYSSFTFDVTSQIHPGSNSITVCAEDDTRSGLQPLGKQSMQYHSYACLYTRTTGIWQTVWLEKVPQTYITSLKLTPDAANSSVHIEAMFNIHAAGGRLIAKASFNGTPAGEGAVAVCGRTAQLILALSQTHLWEPGSPNLYDLSLRFEGNGAADSVESYFGLRSVSWNDKAMLLNGKPLFQRLILDQGFYPDGIYTAPTDGDLKQDIEMAMAMGFNGARLHQKMFEERFLYWADKLGYIVWGEHASWGLDITGPMGLERFLPEWMETLQRDYSHPSLVGWCPFNETHPSQDDNVLAEAYYVTKLFDSTRPVIDSSGYVHVVTDIYDVHDYDQNVETFTARYAPMANGGPVYQNYPGREPYAGQLYFVSEFGGIWWNPSQLDEVSWGYGDRPKSEEEYLARYEGLITALLDNPKVCAFCYTQLTDVELEVNGLYTYTRKAKFDPAVIKRITTKKAAIEA